MGETPDAMNRSERERESTSRAITPESADDAAVEFGIVEIDVIGVDADDDADEQGDITGAAATESSGDSPDAIRQDIEQTRAQMSGTIDEIQERLNPKRLMDEAKETVREATVGKVNSMMNNAGRSASGMIDKIKEHPISAAMIGAGAWWLINKLPDSGRSSYASTYGSSSGSYGSSSSYGSSTSPYARQYGNFNAGGRMRDDDLGSSGSTSYGQGATGGASYGQGLGEMARDATDAVADYSSRGRERVSDLADQTERQFDRWIRDNPLAVGAAAVAIGAAIGMALPETQRERELIGETRDRLVGKAKEAATQKVEQVASSLPGGDTGASGSAGSGSSGSDSTAGSGGGSGAGGDGSAQPGNA
ncbi:MAG: hypothetical protein JWL71_4999 [Acidobacteria bacterium]|nr:hypothetical protein [Acidobacteriota bacterium]